MTWLASVILLTAAAGLWRISHAATTADCLLGIQLLGTTGIAFLLVMAEWQQEPVWRVVALILALLAAVITIALVQLLRGPSQRGPSQRGPSQRGPSQRGPSQ